MFRPVCDLLEKGGKGHAKTVRAGLDVCCKFWAIEGDFLKTAYLVPFKICDAVNKENAKILGFTFSVVPNNG